ncbi:MAG: hypothetical protein ACJASQ_000751 [Crocinitomicaceae bacterium]|jgi:hypothetical protein
MLKLILPLTTLLLSFQTEAQCSATPSLISHTYNGHTYELIKETLSWEDATVCAVARGGYLASIESQLEHDSIFQWLSTDPGTNPNGTIDVFGASSIWLGGTDKYNEGNWVWDGNGDGTGTDFWLGNFSGAPVGGAFSAWGVTPPEPDNSGGDQNYLTWRLNGNNTGLWNDLHAPSSLYFLIEIDSTSAGLDESELLNKPLNVYPVPFVDEINIEYSGSEFIEKVAILTVTGQLIQSTKHVSASKVTLNLSDFLPGNYILVGTLSNGEVVRTQISK